MSLKGATLFAVVGMLLLTVLDAVNFFNMLTASSAGAVATNTVFSSFVHFLASLSVTVFLFVFYRSKA